MIRIFEFFLKFLRVFKGQFYSLMDKIFYYGFGSRFKKFGKQNHIHYPCRITGVSEIEIGNNVHINRGAFIRGDGGLKIGDNVHIARDLIIYTVNHNYEGESLPYDSTNIKKQVIIEKNVWIGIRVTIVPGVKIGEGAIIGAGSVITRDVPPLAIVGSGEQKILKYRNEDHYRLLEKKGIYGGRDGKILEQNI